MIPAAEAPAGRRYLPELTLLVATILWGFAPITTHYGLQASGPLFFVGMRFTISALLLGLVNGPRLRGVTGIELASMVGVGVTMGIAYLLQTAGLMTIASSKSAFIIALYVPLVPLVELAILRRMPRPMVWAGVAMAFAGLVLLAGPAEVAALRLGFGELLTVAGAVITAIEVVVISVFARSVDPRRAAFFQMGFVAVFSFALMPVFGEKVPPLSLHILLPAAFLGLNSAFIQFAMNWAQQSVSPTRATLIYAGEPAYAGIVGWTAGERLPGLAIIGGACVMLSVVVSELRIGGAKR